mmetsp:Transcript_19968/g.62102  ORF Transcript_19968/g.62102 Transcript_19968/m.62102 type:complete len:282 (+) Transcript_19968:581-1426(+)
MRRDRTRIRGEYAVVGDDVVVKEKDPIGGRLVERAVARRAGANVGLVGAKVHHRVVRMLGLQRGHRRLGVGVAWPVAHDDELRAHALGHAQRENALERGERRAVRRHEHVERQRQRRVRWVRADALGRRLVRVPAQPLRGGVARLVQHAAIPCDAHLVVPRGPCAADRVAQARPGYDARRAKRAVDLEEKGVGVLVDKRERNDGRHPCGVHAVDDGERGERGEALVRKRDAAKAERDAALASDLLKSAGERVRPAYRYEPHVVAKQHCEVSAAWLGKGAAR